MRREKFIEFIRHPEKVGTDDLQELEALVERYPYFQAARMLYLKVLYLQAGTRFRHELTSSTVHITDHKQLLHYLNQLPGTHLRNVKSDVHDIPVGPTIYTQEEQAKQIEDLEGSIETKPSIAGNEEENIIDLNISAGYSLTDEEDFVDSDKQTNTKNKNNILIDNFIENNPSMPKAPDTSEDIRDLSEENPYAQDELFTETLAKIYTKQKLYDKAITTYIKLSLKYPEKSVYFANRIEKIKEIINNQE